MKIPATARSRHRTCMVSTLALLSLLPSGCFAADTLTAAGLPNSSNPLLASAVLGGAALAALAVAAISRQEARALKKQLLRQKAKLEVLERSEVHLRASVSVEPHICIVWVNGNPELALHSLTKAKGIPAKLQQLIQFSSWLYPDDAAQVSQCLDDLLSSGAPFVRNACTLEGDTLEAAGGVWGPDAILRFRPLSPLNKDFARIMGENKRLKQTLSDRETLLNALPFPAWLRDGKGALTWVNAAYAKTVHARSRDEAITAQIELFETRQRADLARSLQKKNPERLRLQTVVNGGVHVYEAIVAPLVKGSGGAALDVAPLASAENELERQMTVHSRTLNKVSTGVAIFGSDRKLVYRNDALLQIWNLSETFADGKPSAAEFLDLLRQQRMLPEQSNYRKWRDERISVWESGRVLDELWHLPDGRSIKVLADHREDGGATFLFDDVTEKLSLERRYHTLIEVQRETLDHLSEGLAVFGSDGRLQLFNPAFQSIWSLPPAVLEEMPHIDAIIVHCGEGASGAGLWQAARDAITGIPEERDVFFGTIQRPGQTYLAYAGMPLPDGGTLLTFSDITASKRIEEVLLERNEALEASDRLKSAFLSHVSYELRTPLTSIIGFTDMLSEPHLGSLTPKQREYLTDIKSSSQVLLTIINDILDLAVIDAGGLDLKLEPLKVADVVEAAELGVRERLSRQKIHLDIHIADGVETVIADANRLTQVLYNVLSNAIGFSPEGSTITLACRKERGGIEFSVQDRGLGIPEEEQAAVFERFQSRSHGSRHRGAGLGLSLVKSLVELHNGRLALRSTPGAGTTVTVFLPDRHIKLDRDVKREAAPRTKSTAARY